MANSQKTSVAFSSVLASLFLTITKLIVGILTGSIGIISEAAHSALDLGAAFLTFFAVSHSDKPADIEHHYGHGKIESVSALIETGLLFLTSAWIIYEALTRLLGEKVEVQVTWYSFAVILISILVDFSRSRALMKIAKETKSQALEADALHFSSDILSSLVVLVGLILLSIGIKGADAFAAIGVSIFVIIAGVKLGRRTIGVLIDAAPKGSVEKITEIAKNTVGVISVERIRIRPAGIELFIELIIAISRKLPLEKVKEITSNVENNIKNIYPEADVIISTKPIALDNETVIERLYLLAANQNLPIHDITIQLNEEKTYISFDLEVDNKLNVLHAHEIATKFEEKVKKELGENIEIDTHIEPIMNQTIKSNKVQNADIEKISKLFEEIIKKFSIVKNVHDIKIQKFEEKYFVTAHIAFDNEISLEEAHNISEEIKYLAKQKDKEIQKVIIHIEPFNF